ncbi:MAG: DUF1465 family protein [Alphaproteobacteria bacterium]|nr:MAG: DUF1465 family protein [Alphaproteobacteria bacterium]
MSEPANLIDRTLAESVALTVEARNYIAYQEQRSFGRGMPPDALAIGYQNTRISARLVQVLTWLMAMKAYDSGEITREELIASPYLLDEDDILPGEIEACDPNPMPAGLISLLQRTESLYCRITRLDAMLRKGPPPVPNKRPKFQVLDGGLANEEQGS